jgi:WhiB family redox-sensing transcriptional regulator
VRDLCLDGALARQEPWGVWGGELFLKGTVIPFKRPRGRPRKNKPRKNTRAA